MFKEVVDMRAFSREQRREGKTIGFVPTMVSMRHRRQPLLLNSLLT